MTSQTFDARADVDNVDNRARRLTTETKAAFKTTELIVYVLAVRRCLRNPPPHSPTTVKTARASGPSTPGSSSRC